MMINELSYTFSCMTFLLMFQTPKRKSSLPKQTPCEMCELLVTFAKPYVDSNSTEVSCIHRVFVKHTEVNFLLCLE